MPLVSRNFTTVSRDQCTNWATTLRKDSQSSHFHTIVGAHPTIVHPLDTMQTTTILPAKSKNQSSDQKNTKQWEPLSHHFWESEPSPVVRFRPHLIADRSDHRARQCLTFYARTITPLCIWELDSDANLFQPQGHSIVPFPATIAYHHTTWADILVRKFSFPIAWAGSYRFWDNTPKSV